jgi:hypothetical protein
VTEYLKPKIKTGNLSRRTMVNGIFHNPPLHTHFGGFTSDPKYTEAAGHRYKIGRPSLEKGGPSAQKNKPI